MKIINFFISFTLIICIFIFCGCNTSKKPSVNSSLNNSLTQSEKNNTAQTSNITSENKKLTDMQFSHTSDLYDPMKIIPYTRTGTGIDRDKFEISMYYYYSEGIQSVSDEDTRNMISSYIEKAEEKMRTASEKYSYKYKNIKFIEDVKCINGYCIVKVCCDLLNDPQTNTERYCEYFDNYITNYMCDIAYFDLISKEQLSTSDLFYKDENFISIFNDAISNYVFKNYLDGSGYYKICEDSKHKFEGITEDCMYLDMMTGDVIFPYSNHYFTNSKIFNVEKYKLCYNSVIWQPRDMKEVVNNQTMRLFENQDYFQIINKKEIQSCISDQEKIKRLNDKCRQLYNQKKILLQEFISSSPDRTDLYNSVYDTYKFNLLDYYSVNVDFYNKIIIIEMYINDLDFVQYFIDYETEEELDPLEAAKIFLTRKCITHDSTYDNSNEQFDQIGEMMNLTTDPSADQPDHTPKVYSGLNSDKTCLKVFISSLIPSKNNDSSISVYTEDYTEEK